jgi:hypothetical protein
MCALVAFPLSSRSILKQLPLRLLSNAMNQSAHQCGGLDADIYIARRAQCIKLYIADLWNAESVAASPLV